MGKKKNTASSLSLASSTAYALFFVSMPMWRADGPVDYKTSRLVMSKHDDLSVNVRNFLGRLWIVFISVLPKPAPCATSPMRVVVKMKRFPLPFDEACVCKSLWKKAYCQLKTFLSSAATVSERFFLQTALQNVINICITLGGRGAFLGVRMSSVSSTANWWCPNLYGCDNEYNGENGRTGVIV